MGSVVEQPWAGRHHVITQRIRGRREELRLTQKQVVTRLGRLGMFTSNRALSSLEHGAGLDVAKLPELAAVLDCTVTYLLGLTDDPHDWTPAHPGPPPRPVRVVPPGSAELGQHSWILGAEIPDRRRPGHLTGDDGRPT